MFGGWAEKTLEPYTITVIEINFQLKSSHLFSILGPSVQEELYYARNHTKKSPVLCHQMALLMFIMMRLFQACL